MEYEGRALQDNETIASANIKSDDFLVLKYANNARKETNSQVPLHSNNVNTLTQRIIEEYIRMENVQENFEKAFELLPESFVKVPMLYIHCKVNNVNVVGFVDSGAQSTTMSKSLAERCQ